MGRRSARFYRKNEQEIMRRLGFKPTKNSGAGDVEKEDGENDIAICQLKSTDAQSINIKQNDLHILEYHASVSRKVPVFAIQFLNTDEVWLCMRPADAQIVEKEKLNIFEEKEQKTVDMDPEQEYNKRESDKDLNRRKEAREEYNKRVKTEREEKERIMKERRKEGRKRNLIKQGSRISKDCK